MVTSGDEQSVQLSEDEVVTVDPLTGARKGVKLANFALIPAVVWWLLAEHFGKGATKYAPRNWEAGYLWSHAYNSACRHLTLFWMGVNFDNHKKGCAPDCKKHTGSLHLICALWHLVVLTFFFIMKRGTDDRPKEHRNCLPADF